MFIDFHINKDYENKMLLEEDEAKIEMNNFNQNWSFKKQNDNINIKSYHYVLVFDDESIDDKNLNDQSKFQAPRKTSNKIYLSKNEKRIIFLKNLENAGLEITLTKSVLNYLFFYLL
jgi:hypothetical protein